MKYKKMKQKIQKVFVKSVPLWMVLLIVLNSTLVMGLLQYYLIRLELNRDISQLAKTAKGPEELVELLKKEVIPMNGYKTSLKWKDLGKKLVEAQAIDYKKYEEIFTSDADGKDHMKYLDGSWDDNIQINEKNSRFMVNTLWALGLVNKSKVLDEGPMRAGGVETANMASTGGWSLGSKPAMELYSSKSIIPLTDEQQDLVKKIAENVFRPCCNNSTYFPDCNHGMAALGYIQWAIFNGLSENQIYKDLLVFNSFWFPQNYLEMAIYFDKQNIKWKNVDAKLALSVDYSSAKGVQRIRQSVQEVQPKTGGSGGGCSV